MTQSNLGAINNNQKILFKHSKVVRDVSHSNENDYTVKGKCKSKCKMMMDKNQKAARNANKLPLKDIT